MKRIRVCWIFVFLTMMLISSKSIPSELDQHLRFLAPFLGKDWVGGFVGEGAPDLKISLFFEPLLDGKVVKYSRQAKDADFASVTYFYWNPKLAEVCFISLNNRGIVEEGTVMIDDDKVVLHGNSHRSDMSIEFKTILSIDTKGALRDSFLRKKDNEWIQGHIQEFVAQ